MLLLNLDNNYSLKLPAEIEAAIVELNKLDASALLGEYSAFGGAVKFKITESVTASAERRKFECHRKYIDIHCVLSGEQIIEWSPLCAFKEPQNYDSAADIIFFEESISRQEIKLSATARDIAVFYPEDCHKPLCMIEYPQPIKTCIVKIKI